MNETANVSALGYAAFALTLWLTSMGSAGWFAEPANALLPLLVITLGGCVLALAGIMQWVRGHTLDTVLFLAFAAYWGVAALHQSFMPGPFAPSHGFTGWYEIVWAFLAFCVFLAACKDGVARMLFALGLTLSLLSYALDAWTGLGALTVLGGYLGLVTAVVGIYIAAAEMINETSGHVVLPLGESTQDGKSGMP